MFAPFGNHTANHTATWHPEPSGRGTFGLLSSCITTLILCVCTAIHLNIPEEGKEHLQIYRKGGWLVLGLFAPELVAWNAWEQYRTASRITKIFQKVHPPPPALPLHRRIRRSCKVISEYRLSNIVKAKQDSNSQSLPRSESAEIMEQRHPWTLTHGFYAAMGGFVVQAKDLGPGYDTEAFVFHEASLRLLAATTPELVPNISEAEIIDKSKASTLTKTIVCLQALWFCVQCIARLSQGASISFLELNVLGHCLCVFATYAIWWKKPADVGRPTELPVSDGLREFIDVAYLHSGRPGALPTFPEIPGWYPIGLPQVGFSSGDWNSVSQSLWFYGDTPLESHDRQLYGYITHSVQFGHLLQTVISDKCYSVDFSGTGSSLFLAFKVFGNIWITYVLSKIDMEWRSSIEDLHRVPRVVFDVSPAMAERLERTSKSRFHDLEISPYDYPAGRARNWSLSSGSIYDAVGLKKPFSSITLTIVALVYGGLHLLAWNAPFNTKVEEILWKTSGIIVASIGPVLITLGGSSAVRDGLYLSYGRPSGSWDINFIVIWLPVCCFLLVYLFARVYLVVECFIAVAYLPDSAFTTPIFTRYMPHFG